MATLVYLSQWLCFLFLGYGALAVTDDVALLRRVYTAEIGVREATGRNDGARVSEYLSYTGLGEGYPWCAAFVSFCFGQTGYTAPRTPWSPALFPDSRVIWSRSGRVKDPRKPRTGDVFGIYNTRLGRIAHAGFADRFDGNWVCTVEGNVDHAVIRKRRLLTTLAVMARWTDDKAPSTNNPVKPLKTTKK